MNLLNFATLALLTFFVTNLSASDSRVSREVFPEETEKGETPKTIETTDSTVASRPDVESTPAFGFNDPFRFPFICPLDDDTHTES